MPDDNNDDRQITPLMWLSTSPEAADVLPTERVNFAHRILTNLGPHSSPEQWALFLHAPRRLEKHRFYESAYCPEARREWLAKLTAAEKLSEAGKRGGNTK